MLFSCNWFVLLVDRAGCLHLAALLLLSYLMAARLITDLPSRLSIGSFFPAFASMSSGQYLSAFSLLPATSFCQSSSAPLVCWTMSWPSTMDQTSGLAGRTLPTLAA